jgi:casein kinase I family protein HRR25
MGIDVIGVLKELHSRNIVHRDIKPSNILSGVNEETANNFLIDFGISQIYETPYSEH